MSFTERSNILCPLFGVSFKRGSTVLCILSYNINEIFIIYFSVYSRIERQFKLSLHLSGKLFLNKYVAKSSKV